MLSGAPTMQVFSPDNRYTDRINRVLNYAHFNHNGGHLDLDQLASIASLSKFHFIRVFQDCVGESPMRYLKRTRMERAGSLVKHETDLSVFEIAYRCGFNSAQSFSREFSNKFGCAPRSYRTNHLNILEDNAETSFRQMLFKKFTLIGIDPDFEQSASKIQIKDLKPTRVAYIRSIGRQNGGDLISLSMESMKNWARERGIWSDKSEFIGISWDFSSMTPDSLRRYDAAISIPNNLSLEPGYSSQTIPGGTYAVTQVSYRSVEDFILIWKWFGMALESANKFRMYRPRLNTGPWYEVYKRKTEKNQNCIEIYAPLDLRK